MAYEIDPVRYEVFRHRLFNILEEGRIALKMVSGSPVVVEGGETMCSLHRADGSTILVAAGILLHAVGARQFIQKAIELYENDPGFNDGDQLFFNDPYLGGQHLADMVVIKPIFYKGRRIAWTGSVCHTAETGGMAPGGMPPRATVIFHEGIRILGLKVVEGGKFRPDVYTSIVQQVRDPHLVGLDLKAKIAACNTCAQRYLNLIDKFGLEFVEAAGDKLVSDAEERARAKLKSLPDGVWRSRLYGDNSGLVEKPFKVVCTMTKEGDRLTFDFTGSSPQNEGSNNETYPATWGSLFVTLCSQLFWDLPWNDGFMTPIQVIAPEGTVVNCRFPAACSNGVQTAGAIIQEATQECVAKMLYAGGLIEDVNSAWKGSTGGAPFFGGINQFGQRCAGVILDSFAGGMGATPYRDGVDSGGNKMNPQSSISDVEMIDMTQPLMYLQRKNLADTGGFGKFRGGNATQQIYMVYGTNSFRLGLMGTGRRAAPNFGLFGGYPASVHEARYGLNTELPEWFRKSKSPQTFEEVRAAAEETIDPPNSYDTIPTKEYDVLIQHFGGGGGYGDPLDRDPELVAKDVRDRDTSFEAAQKVYRVVLDPRTFEVDRVATEKARDEARQERLRLGKPVSAK
jgi:N-methylhydantoinase B